MGGKEEVGLWRGYDFDTIVASPDADYKIFGKEMDMEKETAMEELARGRTSGTFRCLNCFARISPPPGAKTYKCQLCGFEWRIYWLDPTFPRIRGPVWDVNRRLAEEELVKQKGRE